MAHPPDISGLLPESVDNLIKFPLRHHDINDDNIANIEMQQAVVNAILKTLRKDTLESVEVIRVFERILGIDTVIDEFPADFFVLLSKEEILSSIVKYCNKMYVYECRVQQLCYCVLIKILESCDSKNTRFFLNVLFRKEELHSDVSYTLTIYLENCGACGVSNSSLSVQQYYCSIAIIFRFMLQAYSKLEVSSTQAEIRDRLFNLTYSCVNECSTEEDLVEYGMNLLASFLKHDRNKCLMFINDGNYRLVFHVISQNPFEEGVLEAATSLLMTLFLQCVLPSCAEDENIVSEYSVGLDSDISVVTETEECEIYTKASISYFSSESVVFIFDKLNFYEDRPSLALKFLKIVEKISCDLDIAENLIDQNAVMLLTEQMDHHSMDSMVQLTAINAVDKLNRLQSEGMISDLRIDE